MAPSHRFTALPAIRYICSVIILAKVPSCCTCGAPAIEFLTRPGTSLKGAGGRHGSTGASPRAAEMAGRALLPTTPADGLPLPPSQLPTKPACL